MLRKERLLLANATFLPVPLQDPAAKEACIKSTIADRKSIEAMKMARSRANMGLTLSRNTSSLTTETELVFQATQLPLTWNGVCAHDKTPKNPSPGIAATNESQGKNRLINVSAAAANA